jgi:putative DNA primase/helicase
MKKLSEVNSRPIQWIWEGVLARGMLTILQGDPGMGKGLVTIDIAARLTRALPMPGAPLSHSDGRGAGGEGDITPESQLPHNVLLCTTEDMRSFTERPRAEAAGADLERIYFMDELLPFTRKPKQMVEATARMIEEYLRSSEIRLVVIDPLLGFLQSLAASDSQSVRYALMALTDLAEKYGCAILAVLHLNKNRSASALYRGGGSIAFAAVARFVYSIGRDPENPSRRILACVKNNVSDHPRSLAFEIVPHVAGEVETAQINWLGESDLTADDLLARSPSGAPSALETAESLLYELLWDGPLPERKVNAEAGSREISVATLRRAKARMKVKSVWNREADCWDWELPYANPKRPEGGVCAKNEHLVEKS